MTVTCWLRLCLYHFKFAGSFSLSKRNKIKKMLISEVNALGFEEFIKIFGNVVEMCPLVAAAVWSNLPFQDLESLQNSIETFVDQLPLAGDSFVYILHTVLYA